MIPLGNYQSRLLKLDRFNPEKGILWNFTIEKDGLPVQSFTLEN
jgi:hypothetical protein